MAPPNSSTESLTIQSQCTGKLESAMDIESGSGRRGRSPEMMRAGMVQSMVRRYDDVSKVQPS